MQVKCIHDSNKSEFQSTHFRRIHLRLLYLIIVLSKDNACTKRLDRILISIRSTNYFRKNPYRLDKFEWMRISSTLNFWKSQMQNPIRIQKHEITILCNFGNDTRFSRGLSGLFYSTLKTENETTSLKFWRKILDFARVFCGAEALFLFFISIPLYSESFYWIAWSVTFQFYMHTVYNVHCCLWTWTQPMM